MSNRILQQREVLKQAIQATADATGTVTPSAVVEAARDPDNPLHGEFDWDDTSAAHQHRLAVARSLIREIRYEVPNMPRRTITSVSYVHRPGSVQAYIPLSRVAKNKKLAQAVLNEELSRCIGAINRARQVADVLGLRDRLEELLDEIVKLKEEVD